MQNTAVDNGQIMFEEADRLLELSRRTRWDFPTSMGRPVKWGTTEDWVKRLEVELDSFIRVTDFLLQHAREDSALEIAANIWRLWVLKRDDDGGRRFLGQVLEKTAGRTTRARALAAYGDSLLAFRSGRLDESRKRSLEVLEIAGEVNDPETLVLGNLAMSRVSLEDGDYEKARSHAGEARKNARTLNVAFGQAPLFMEATSYRMMGDYDKAAPLFEESLELNRRIADRGMVFAELNNLSFVEIHRNNGNVAERLFLESQSTSGPEDEDPYGRGMMLLNKAGIEYRKGKIAEARSLLQTARSTFEKAKIQPARDDRFEFDWLEKELNGSGMRK